ncbi:hypothetical protein [Flavobacterium sp. GT3R68]|uniref:hypothetical protein n=1 Tax=Flavobacterium sp. GT3R68 TaxID=2594437 RepID=UPI000F876C03|nr:hypothetical protein [Flavobacterium sp. GT3R68]RTY95828.1 hypothetical protein EKL32_04070 [Flavobacterium sp. GSN2]TRW93600.1 hypothetical protein FNW07_01460 [Flavobacterium sp. GT3R68]
MKETIQHLDNRAKFSLLTSTLGFAILILLIVNLLDLIMYMLLLLQEPSFDSIILSLKEGHYAINGKKMGLSLFYNFMVLLFLWALIIWHTLKTINNPSGWNLFFDIHIRQFD